MQVRIWGSNVRPKYTAECRAGTTMKNVILRNHLQLKDVDVRTRLGRSPKDSEKERRNREYMLKQSEE